MSSEQKVNTHLPHAGQVRETYQIFLETAQVTFRADHEGCAAGVELALVAIDFETVPGMETAERSVWVVRWPLGECLQ